VILDGMAKTNLTLGPRNGDRQYAQLVDVNIYYVDDFDFRAYFTASTQGRYEMLLAALEKTGQCCSRWTSKSLTLS
jgi:hypothetical protein